jgi:CheY-like chemotaxis protein
LKEGNLNCVVLELPGGDGFQVLRAILDNPKSGYLPIIAWINGALAPDVAEELRRAAKVCVVKEVPSLERVMDEVALFLHQEIAHLPEAKRDSIERMHQSQDSLTGRKVLVVDDDIRTIFAMTSLLEHQRMQVLSAESGREAIALLEKTPDIDIVLMDIMMPEMDGYDTMQAIRRIEAFKSLPIVALTAKAMKGDREKCIESGASDYVTKPVDTELLLDLMRTWLNR